MLSHTRLKTREAVGPHSIFFVPSYEGPEFPFIFSLHRILVHMELLE